MAAESSPTGVTPGVLCARAMAATRPFVSGIEAGQLEDPTPCTEWNLRQLLNHMVYGIAWIEDIFDGKTVEAVGGKFDGDLLGDDPLAAYDAAVRSATVALGRPGVMEFTCHLRRGDATGAQYATSMFTDIFIHGWDIAIVTGQDPTLEEELVAACYAIVEPNSERYANSPAFGAPIAVPADAGIQTKLLGMLGRGA
jgi:uncharacterized protein (TIGR03086 family)